jgi:protein-S-isoprenylcysteine O-methyltransferase Ste14
VVDSKSKIKINYGVINNLARSGTLIQRWRVPLGFILGGLFLFLSRPESLILLIGGVVAVTGLLIRAWASGHIRKNAELAVSGPYSFTRNPLYFGSFLLVVGFGIAAGVWWLGVLFALLFLAIYLPVMRAESQELRQIFGESYEKYAQTVPLFVPRLFPRIFENKTITKFDFGLYLRYREYRAALGLLLIWGFLTLKAFWLR